MRILHRTIWKNIIARREEHLAQGASAEQSHWLAVADVEAKMMAEKLRREEPVDLQERWKQDKRLERVRAKVRLNSLHEALDAAERMVAVARTHCSVAGTLMLEREIHIFRRAADRARPARRKVA